MTQPRSKVRNKNFKQGKASDASKIAIDRIKFKKHLKKYGIAEAAFSVLLVADKLYQENEGLFTVTEVMTTLNKKRAVSEMHLKALVDGGLLERVLLGNFHRRTQFGITKEGFALIKKGGRLFFSSPVLPASPLLSHSGSLQTKHNSQADALTGLTFTPLDL